MKNNFIKDIACFLLKKNNNIFIYLKNNVFDIIYFLKNSLYFSLNQLLDFSIVDRLEMSIKIGKRFEYFYLLNKN